VSKVDYDATDITGLLRVMLHYTITYHLNSCISNDGLCTSQKKIKAVYENRIAGAAHRRK
jgi:hypothetical protein